MKFDWKLMTVAAAAMLTTSIAQAATVNVGGTGVFDIDAPTTAESAPGQTFTFSFITQDPIPGNPNSALINPTFTLAGNGIAPTITSVQFYDSSDNGLFDLTFSDHNVLSLYGDQIDMGGYLQSGYYRASIGLAGGTSIGVGGVSVSVNVSPVPLPASAPLFGGAVLALAAGSAALKRGRRARSLA